MTDGFPSLDTYLGRLPQGLGSYPDMSCKASVLRAILADAPAALTARGVSLSSRPLPPRLEELIRSPPPPTGWLLEVEIWAISLCIYDLAFADHGGFDAYVEWAYARNRALLGGPLYRILFALLRPERLIVGAAQRYAAFHRGTLMSKVDAAAHRCAFTLTTPPHVLPDVGRAALVGAFRASLDLAGARDARVTAEAESPEVVAFAASWR